MELFEEQFNIWHGKIYNIVVPPYKGPIGNKIEKEEYVRDPGVIINEKLEFEDHIEKNS